MTDRVTRTGLGLFGLLIGAGGALTVCLGAGVFGTARRHRHIFDPTVSRWWDEGGWESFAVVAVIGLVLVLIGFWLVLPQLRRNDGLVRTAALVLPSKDGEKGDNSLRPPALSHAVEADLERFGDVRSAMVGLFGLYPDIEMRVVLEVTDDVALETLPDRFDQVLSRLRLTAGVRPDPVQVTVRFSPSARDRQLA